MFNLSNFKKFIPKTEQVIPKNVIVGLLALLGSSTMVFPKGNESVLKDAEKKIESMDASNRRDYVKNMYLELDNGFLQDSAEAGEIVGIDDEHGSTETTISYDAQGKTKMLSVNKLGASLPDDIDTSDTFTRDQQKAFIKEAKTLFLHASENKDLFPKLTNEQEQNEELGINEYDIDITFYDVDGSGSVDAFGLDMFGQEIIVGLVDKSELIQKAKDINMAPMESRKRLKDAYDKLKQVTQSNGQVVVTDQKYVKMINEQYAAYLKVLCDIIKEIPENQ